MQLGKINVAPCLKTLLVPIRSVRIYLFEIESEISVLIDGYRRYLYHLERRDRREASVPEGRSEKASVRDKPHDGLGKGRFSPNYKL